MKNIPYKKAHRRNKQTVNRRSGAKTKSEDGGACAAVPGDRAALIAPSFAVTPEQLAKAEKSIRLLGLTPVIYPSCRSRQRLSGGKRPAAGAGSGGCFLRFVCPRRLLSQRRLWRLSSAESHRFSDDPEKSQIFYRIQRHHRTSYSAQSGVRADHLSRPPCPLRPIRPVTAG